MTNNNFKETVVTVKLDDDTLMDYVINEAARQLKNHNEKILKEYENCHTPKDYLNWLLSFKTKEEITRAIVGYVETKIKIIFQNKEYQYSENWAEV